MLYCHASLAANEGRSRPKSSHAYVQMSFKLLLYLGNDQLMSKR